MMPRIVSPLLPMLLTAFALSAAPALAQTNDNAANAGRLERLERDLMLLQRQVARGGPDTTPAAGGDSTAALPADGSASIEAHLSQIEEEMRKLRGKLEEGEFRDKQLGERLDRMQKDVEFRFGELSGTKPTAKSDAPPATTSTVTATSPAVMEVKTELKAVSKPEAAPEVRSQTVPLSQPPHDLSATANEAIKPNAIPAHDAEELNRMVEEVATESSVPKEDAKPESKSDAKTETVPAETSAGDGQLKPPASEAKDGPREQYNTAFKLLNQTKYDESAAQFSDFAQKYPKDPLIGNAYYWLGETHYIRRDYVKAADSFRQGFEAMPTGPKAADNLLKLSMSLSAMQKNPEACVVLDQILVKFNKTSSAVTQKAQQERTRIACK